MLRTIKNIIYLLFPVILAVSGCVDPLNAPDTLPPLIELYKPAMKDTIYVGKTEIIYHASDNAKLYSVQLYIDGIKINSVNAKSDGSAPDLYWDIDSTWLGRKVSMYLTATDYSGQVSKSNQSDSILISNLPVFNLFATPLTTKSIQLDWVDNDSKENGFVIQRRASNQNEFSEIARVKANSQSYIDANGLQANGTYTYRVASVYSTGLSVWSNEVTITTPAQNYLPPSSLSAVQMPSSKKVVLTWTNNTTQYGTRIERKTGSSGTYAEIGNIDYHYSTYTDESLTDPGTYFYRVRNILANGEFTAYSNEVQLKINELPPNAPDSLGLLKLSSTIYNLRWRDNSNDEDGFELWRRDGDEPNSIYNKVKTLPKNSISINDIIPADTMTYYYMVRAYRGSDYSAFSNVINSTGGRGNLPRPTSLKASVNNGKVTLTWNYPDKPANILGFTIERRASWDLTFQQVTMELPISRQWVDQTVSKGVAYIYRIRVSTSTEVSDFSDEVTITIPTSGLGKTSK